MRKKVIIGISVLLIAILLFFGIKTISNNNKSVTIKEDNQLLVDESTNNNVNNEIIEDELPDIQIEDEIELTNEKDISNMTFWIVTYDQFGNEVSRTTAKYGSTIKDPDGNDVVVKGNIYFHITVDDSSSSKDSNSSNPIGPKEINYLYLKNIGTEDATFYLCDNGNASNDGIAIQYSYDKEVWYDASFDFDISIPVGESVYLKAKTSNPYFNDESLNGLDIESTDGVNEAKALEVGGSVMTLLDATDTLRDISNIPGCFSILFYEMANIANADNLVFPATKLSEKCYDRAFLNCTGLKSVNSHLLPANNLTGANNCYEKMFINCVSLTNAPNLPATKLSEYCYLNMFSGCSSLTNVPKLPATKLKSGCYQSMFYNCTSLVTLPKNLLPASDLTNASSCYSSMFEECSSLTNVPNLRSKKLSDHCYSKMFYLCSDLENVPDDLLPSIDLSNAPYCYDMMFCKTNISSVPNLPAKILSEGCYYQMFNNCNNLESVPENLLPATDLSNAPYCYSGLFEICGSLINVPNLPADKLSEGCYSRMFSHCVSLVNVPQGLLPATDLRGCNSCYEGMFMHCSNLENIPKLPATQLSNSCYKWIFNNCSKISYVEVGFSSFDGLPSSSTFDWLVSVAESGTFKWPGESELAGRSTSTVPENWSIAQLD